VTWLKVRMSIASAINVIVQLARLPDGKRRVVSVSEITGLANDVIQLQDLFRFEQQGVDAEGAIYGLFCATGVTSRYNDHFRVHGLDLPADVFTFSQEAR